MSIEFYINAQRISFRDDVEYNYLTDQLHQLHAIDNLIDTIVVTDWL